MNRYDILTAPIDEFGTIADRWDTVGNGALFHIDNGAGILGVAHLDVVLTGEPLTTRGRIYTPMLDNRWGVDSLLNKLPAMGIDIDGLLTTGEESGRSTAKYYDPHKQYNWIVEFDRCGSDVVLYDYDTPERRAMLADYFAIGRGSYSDISVMEGLKVFAFNVGVGYHGEHTMGCYVDLDESDRQLARFASFHRDYANTPMEHEPWEWDASVDNELDDIIQFYGVERLQDAMIRNGYDDAGEFIQNGGEDYLALT